MNEILAFMRRSKGMRRAVGAVIALLLLWAVAWLAVPPIVKSQAEQRASALLGREVRVGRIGFAPWSLTLTIEQLTIASTAGSARREPQFALERAVINADLRSILRLAPVIEALQIDGPVLRIARVAEGRYDIDDITARLAALPKSESSEPARFALYNLRLARGSVEFDDQPFARVHRVADLEVALPFLSNLPADVTVNVEPRLSFKLNGASFDSGAQTKPFATDRSSQIDLKLAELDLAPWLPYVPVALPIKPLKGRLASQLQLRFALAADGTPSVSVKGQASLSDAAFQAGSDAAPAIAWRRLDVALTDVQPLARKVALGSVALADARIDARRDAQGRINLMPASKRDATAPAAAASSAAGGWQASVEKIAVTQARVDWHDAATRPAAAVRADAIELQAGPLRWPFEMPLPLTLAAQLGALDAQGAILGESATLNAQGQLSDKRADIRGELKGLNLAWLEPYVAPVLAARIDGRAAASGALSWAGGDKPVLQVSDIAVQVESLRLADSSRGRPPLTLAALTLAGTQIDLIGQQVNIGSLKLERPSLALSRDAQGRWNFDAWLRANDRPGASAPSPAPAWKVQLAELALNGGDVRLSDQRPAAVPSAPVQVTLAAINASVKGLNWPAGAPARTQLALRVVEGDAAPKAVNPARVEWNGQVTPAPLAAKGTLRVERFPLHAFEPYFGSGLNLALLRAEATWRGDLSVAQRGSDWDASAKGDVLVADLRVHERTTTASTRGGDELLTWQSLALKGLAFDLRAGTKPQLAIAEAALTDFYSRLVITEEGRFNLRDVAAAPKAEAAPVAASAPALAASAPADVGLPIDVAIGGVRLTNGRVDFTDRFIKPNYSAALSELNGTLGSFNSTSRDMAALDLKGRAAGTALLEIGGSINPTARPLALDIKARATDLELAPLSPYAGRYAGYAIERGKLSMDVAYKIDPDGKLEARNQIILNQLTFGDKVDSPDATKLPVRLVIALLTDRNGVIDINLPISGSINDPQFSIFGIVLKIIGNLLVKALTAPFALLAGGGSEDLSFVGFTAGTAAFSDSGRGVIDKVAKALTDRPALRMTVTGAADPASERDAIQRAALQARIRAEQRRDALRAGAASDAPLPALTPPQRDALVKRIYDDTKLPDKPRNAIGLAKTIPAPEMEALLMKATVVSADSAHELALQRGLAVRDALVAKGLPSERLFLAAPKLRASAEEDKEWSPRVQLALSTN
jgi:uncharacterized protein involved in outer membrane biogenesis